MNKLNYQGFLLTNDLSENWPSIFIVFENFFQTNELISLFCFNFAFLKSGCSAVGSALRSGRRGRAFESPHSDNSGEKSLSLSAAYFLSNDNPASWLSRKKVGIMHIALIF